MLRMWDVRGIEGLRDGIVTTDGMIRHWSPSHRKKVVAPVFLDNEHQVSVLLAVDDGKDVRLKQFKLASIVYEAYHKITLPEGVVPVCRDGNIWNNKPENLAIRRSDMAKVRRANPHLGEPNNDQTAGQTADENAEEATAQPESDDTEAASVGSDEQDGDKS